MTINTKQYDNIILSQDVFLKQLEYWKGRFNEDISSFTVFDVKKTGKYEKHTVKINKQCSDRIKSICNNSPIAILVAVTAAYNIFLSKITNNKDVLLLSPVIGDENQNPYNRIVVLNSKIEGADSFRDVLGKTKQIVVNAYNNELYPFEKILNVLDCDIQLEDLSDICIRMNGLHHDNILSERFEKIGVVVYNNECIELEYNYDTGISTTDIIAFANMFSFVLEKCISNINIKVSEVSFYSDNELEEMLNLIQHSKKSELSNISVKELFEACAEKNKDAVAVRTTTKRTTYKELDIKANQLAHKLISEGIKKSDVVGVCLNPSDELIIAMLAIIKLGAIYLPIDFQMPRKRLEYIIDDSEMKLIIYSKDKTDYVPSTCRCLFFDDYNSAGLEMCSENAVDVALSENDPVYIIYTSGTTGMPKGVKVPNRGILNYNEWFRDYAELKTGDKTVLTSSYAFDLGYTGLYSALLNGLELNVLRKEEYTNPDLLLDYLNDNNITYMKTTPSFMKIIIDNNKFLNGAFSKVRLLLFGGENINLSDIQRIHGLYPNLVIANHYGPTETTIGVVSTKIDFEKFEEYKETPVIGKAINNTDVYIMNDYMDIMPFGFIGELYISGKSVSIGYVNNTELTSEKFVADPYNKGSFMYKTNDLAKMLSDGSIVFYGRSDNQVKIHGYRVEKSEIEYALKQHSGIDDAVVVVKSDETGNYIVAYLVSSEENDVAELRSFLSNYLADYMIPKYFIAIDRIPITENGKIDYRKLPQDISNTTKNEYVAPANETEQFLCDIWTEVLKCKRIGTKDDFFVLGGDSIKAIQISSRLKALGYDIELKDIFEKTTIKELADGLSSASVSTAANSSINNTEKFINDELANEIEEYYKENYDLDVEEIFPLSPMQKVMYKYTSEFTGVTPYYHYRTLTVNSKLDIDKVRTAYKLLFDQYQILRTLYWENNNGELYQVAFKNRETDIEYYDISELNDEEQHEYLKKETKRDMYLGYDLNIDMLMRVKLYKTGENMYFVIWSYNHMIIDGWSRMILLKQFFANLKAIKTGNRVDIVKNNFSEYIYRLENRDHEKACEYWKNYITDYNSVSLIPRNDYHGNEYVQKNVYCVLNTEETDRLSKVAASYNASLNIIILTLWGKLLQEISYQDDVIFGSLVADRAVGVQDTDVSVGSFTNVMPIRMKNNEEDIAEEISKVKMDTIEAIDYSYYALESDSRFDLNEYFMESSIIFENYPIEEGMKKIYQGSEKTMGNVKIFDQPHGSLNIFVLPFETIKFKFSFNVNVFSKEKIQEIAELFMTKLKTLPINRMQHKSVNHYGKNQ